MAFTARDWIFAFKVALAALLALGIAFWIDLPRPYWAVVSVYTVSQPLSGATTSLAAFASAARAIEAIPSRTCTSSGVRRQPGSAMAHQARTINRQTAFLKRNIFDTRCSASCCCTQAYAPMIHARGS